MPIKALVYHLAATCAFYLFHFHPQVSEGLQADTSLLDDSDLEARLNRWNLGVSPRAEPRALGLHVGATSC